MRVIYQNEVAECGYACLAMVLTHFGRATEVREISAFRPASSHGLSLTDLYDVALAFGLTVQAFQFGANDLAEIKKGSILHFGGSHYVVFESCTQSYVRLIDPASGRRRISMDIFLANVSGYLLECAPTPGMPRVRARSRIPAALARVRAMYPSLRRKMGKIMFVALAGQLTILALPSFGRLVLDDVVPLDNWNLLDALALTFSGIFLMGAAGQYAQRYLVDRLYGLVRVNATEGVIGHLLRNPFSYFAKRPTGDIYAKVKAQDEISAHAVRTTMSLYIDTAVAALALMLMLLQSPMMTAVALLIFAFYAGIATTIFMRMRDTHTLVAEESSRCDGMLIETLRAAPLIKLSSGELRYVSAYMARFKSYAAAFLRDARLQATCDAALKLTTYAGLVAITWLSARLMLKGSMTVGVFYAFVAYHALASERLARSLEAIFAYFMLEAPAARLADIVECEEERYTPMAERHKAAELSEFRNLELRDVTYRYGISDHPALSKVSLEIKRGDKIVITGPSGGGKSTLFSLLAAAEPATQGTLLLNGIEWPSLCVDQIRRHVAHLRQGDMILPGSIVDNISLFAAHADEQRILRLLDQVGLLAEVMRLPMRTRTVISDTIANISAGQRQRLLLARALYQDSELLLLDEPTSNLDPASVAGVADLLHSLDRTVVIATHDMSLASTFARRYRMVDGTLVPDELPHEATPSLSHGR